MNNIFFPNSTKLEEIEIASQVFGYLSGALVVGYNIPQLVKIVKTKSSDDVAMLSLIFQFILNLLVITYGILLGEIPIITSESLACIICISIMILKCKFDKKIIKKKKKEKQKETQLPQLSDNIIKDI